MPSLLLRPVKHTLLDEPVMAENAKLTSATIAVHMSALYDFCSARSVSSIWKLFDIYSFEDVLCSMLPALDTCLLDILSDRIPKWPTWVVCDGPYPRLFREIWTQIYNKKGIIRPIFPRKIVRGFRTILLMSKKVSLDFSPSDLARFENEQVSADNHVVDFSHVEFPKVETVTSYETTHGKVSSFDSNFYKEENIVGRAFHRELLKAASYLRDDGVYRFGPGTTAEGFRKPSQKCGSIPTAGYGPCELLRVFPALFTPSRINLIILASGIIDVCALFRLLAISRIDSRVSADSSVSRGIFVPKKYRTPRFIAAEPAYYSLLQQQLMSRFREGTERYCRDTGALCSFLNQETNKELARVGSISGELSTIDLSMASDLIKLDLISKVFPEDLFREIMISTTRFISLPSGRIFRKTRLSSMGSAVTFPVLTWVCYCAAYSVVRQSFSEEYARKHVSAYGDDLVVPTSSVSCVISFLESIGLKINRQKTFSSGYFRESCGKDFFRGHDISPVYIRENVPVVPRKLYKIKDGSLRHVLVDELPVFEKRIVSSVDLSRRLHVSGFRRSAFLVEAFVSGSLKCHPNKRVRNVVISRRGNSYPGLHFFNSRSSGSPFSSYEKRLFGYITPKKVVYKSVHLTTLCYVPRKYPISNDHNALLSALLGYPSEETQKYDSKLTVQRIEELYALAR